MMTPKSGFMKAGMADGKADRNLPVVRTEQTRGFTVSDAGSSTLLDLVSGRRGHFLLESGHHGELWLDLDPLFADPRRIDPYVSTLADALARHRVEVVCGPLLGGAFLAQLISRSIDVEFCFTSRVMPGEAKGLWVARYPLPAAFVPRVAGRRVAIVDDAMSAGSSLRATFSELRTHGALVVAVGALFVLGTAGEAYFAERGVPVEAVVRDDHRLWLPDACPLCAAGIPLETVPS
jgi:orotate phosphoribosyltransferase